MFFQPNLTLPVEDLYRGIHPDLRLQQLLPVHATRQYRRLLSLLKICISYYELMMIYLRILVISIGICFVTAKFFLFGYCTTYVHMLFPLPYGAEGAVF